MKNNEITESRALPRGIPSTWRGYPHFAHAWVWHAADGTILGHTVRYENDSGEKCVIPFFKTKDSEWVSGGPDGKSPLHGLDTLEQARTSNIIVVEGEKCASALRHLGIAATTSLSGAQSAEKADWSPLERFSEVIILPDNDDAGRTYAETVAALCASLPGERSIFIAELPGLGEGEDIVDWLRARTPEWSGYGPVPQREPGEDYGEEVISTIEQRLTHYDPAIETVAPPAKSTELKRGSIVLPGPADVRGLTQPEFKAKYCTDVANAGYFAGQQGEDLLHSNDHGWLVWDGKRWRRDNKAVRRLAQQVGKGLKQAVKASDLPREETEQLQKHAKYMQSSRGIDAMLKETACLEGIDVGNEEFDTEPWLLNCPNGVVDLRTGELLDHHRDFRLTALCPTRYNPDATCPRFERFLHEVFSGDTEVVEYFQWVMGYLVTGSTAHQMFFILHGNGANGKSTLLSTLQSVLGADYSQQVDAETLLQQRHQQHPTGIARLRGARLAVCMETGTGRRLNEPLIKALTGGDLVVARRMREDPFEFKPELKLFIGTNAPPVIADYSDGMWRRIRLLPFEEQFRAAQRDSTLDETLKAEREGILAMAVAHASQVKSGEPPLPERVRAATEQYKHDQDMLSQFIEERCVVGEANATVTKAEFFEQYMAWRGTNAHDSQRSITQRMKTLGYEEGRSMSRRYWKGIRLKQLSEFAA